METLSSKVVITRKKHVCNACGREFKKGSRMNVCVCTDDNIYSVYVCDTCNELLINHPSDFDDGCGFFDKHCVHDSLERGQTPEDLLRSYQS